MPVNKSPRFVGGFAILEVLITILILAFGILGLVALQSRALAAEMESYQRAQAMVIAQDMKDRIETSRKNASAYIGMTVDAVADCSGYSGVVQSDCQEWANLLVGTTETMSSNNVGAMLGALGCVTRDNDGQTYRVTVAWQGLSSTFAPPASGVPIDCGKNAFKNQAGATDETVRRWVSLQFQVADQSTI